MTGFCRRMGLVIGLTALWAAAPASAQENLDKGKTPAELYASDCAICHKSPRGLAKGVGLFGLNNFLREHYTASRQSAAAISAYLQKIDSERAPRRARSSKRKPSEPKLPPARPAAAKSSETKPAETKSTETKPSETKPAETKSTETKPSETKPAETKSTETKPSEGKPSAASSEQAKASATKDSAKAEAPKADAGKPAKDTKPEKKSD